MSYFTKFPLTTYEFNSSTSIVKDIFRRNVFISEYTNYTDLYTSYTIVDGDTPDSLAVKFYQSPTFHCVILLFNEIHSVDQEWPLQENELTKYCGEKYGEYLYHTKHYEYEGNVVGQIKDFSLGNPYTPPVFPGLGTAVSFYDYETELNDKKRQIQILRVELLSDFVTQFQNAINV